MRRPLPRAGKPRAARAANPPAVARRRPWWRRLLPALFTLLLLALAPMIVHAALPDTVTVRWTAPGDDHHVGRATAFDLRWSTSPITNGNFATATPVSGVPAPEANGTVQQVVVRGLTHGTRYYFAIKTVDDAGNWSTISNVVAWDWVYDTSPPAAPRGGTVTREEAGIRARWFANTESDLAGYHLYRATAAGGPYARVNPSLLADPQYVDAGVPTDATNVWYQATAVDVSGNESPRSTPFSLSLGGSGAEWAIESGYPNPSRAGDVVRIPVVLPLSGSEAAVVDILDAAGHRVRRIDLAGMAPGRQEVTWDGRNDFGRETAPGVYRAWIIAGGTRKSVGLLRVP